MGGSLSLEVWDGEGERVIKWRTPGGKGELVDEVRGTEESGNFKCVQKADIVRPVGGSMKRNWRKGRDVNPRKR